MKKVLAIVLALLLCLQVCALAEVELADCSKMTIEEAKAYSRVADLTGGRMSDKESYDAKVLETLPLAEGVTFEVMFPREVLHGDFENMWSIRALAEKTGITLKINAVESASWPEKKNLAFAAGDYSDIFITGLNASDAAQYGEQGILLDLSPLIAEHAPLTEYLLSCYPEVGRSVTSPNGSIYYMPTFSTNILDTLGGTRYYLNSAWFERLGVSIPTTLDAFYDYCKAVKENDANGNGDPSDEIPLSLCYSDGFQFNMLLPAFGFVNAKYDVIDGKFVYVPAAENFRAYVEYMNKLYTEGLLDTEYFTQSNEQLTAKIQSERVGLIRNDPWSFFPEKEQWQEFSVLLPALTSAYSEQPQWVAGENNGGNSYAITDKCTDPVLAIKLLDYLYTDEASIMNRWGAEYGTEGVEGGWEKLGDWEFALHLGEYNSFWTWRMANGLMSIPIVLGEATHPIFAGNEQSSWGQACIFISGIMSAARLGFPTISYSIDEQEKLSTFVDLDNYVSSTVAKFITGDIALDDAGWADYIANMEQLGLNDLIVLQQGAYDRWKNS